MGEKEKNLFFRKLYALLIKHKVGIREDVEYDTDENIDSINWYFYGEDWELNINKIKGGR